MSPRPNVSSRVLWAALPCAAALLLWSGCTRRSPPPGEPVGRPAFRLLQRAHQAEITWPATVTGKPAPAEMTVPRIARAAARDRLVRMIMPNGEAGVDNRAALKAPTGTRYTFRVRLPSHPVLRVGLGTLFREADAGVPLRFTVTVVAGDGSRTVVHDETLVEAQDGAWQDRTIDLATWAEQRIALELATAGDKDRPTVWGAWAAPEVVGLDHAEPGFDVILISLDTLRADHLGCYGYQRPTSPHIDALAAQAYRFASAISQAPWTRPSHRSFLSGIYPCSAPSLRSVPLAFILWKAGYRTAAFTGGGQLDSRLGFDDGFETYRTQDWIRDPEAVLDWLDRSSHRKRFLFLHTYEIHDPYTHAEFAEGLPSGRLRAYFDKYVWEKIRSTISDDEKAYVKALYDGGIAFTDRQLDLLFEGLRRRGMLDHTVVILTADHGEQLFEHGYYRHGQNLYDHQLHVPLILHVPSRLRNSLGLAPPDGGAVIEEQVELVDLYPTLLDLLGIEATHQVNGRSLRPLLAGASLAPRAAFAEKVNITEYERKGLRTPEFKFIHSFPQAEAKAKGVREYVELYDLRRDPGEQSNLARELPETAARLDRQLMEIMGGSPTVEPPDVVPEGIDEALKERLKALGYAD